MNPSCIAPWLLLAQRSPLEDMTTYFRGPRVQLGPRDALVLLLGLVGLILLLWLLSVLMNWQERGYRRPSPARLFLHLSRAHRLTWHDTWLLWRLARLQRLSDPARLFLEPDRFERRHLVGSLRHSVSQLEKLREKLFADLETPHRNDRGSREDGRDPSWNIPTAERLGTPLAPITPTPQLRL